MSGDLILRFYTASDRVMFFATHTAPVNAIRRLTLPCESETMIELTRLTKSFSKKIAVNNLSCTIAPGEVLGVLGPNGAGKSTFMRMLAGFVRPTSGTLSLYGVDVIRHTRKAQRLIGYLPEQSPCYSDMSARGFLTFIAEMRGYRGAQKRQRVASMMERFGLEDMGHYPIEDLSKGHAGGSLWPRHCCTIPRC